MRLRSIVTGSFVTAIALAASLLSPNVCRADSADVVTMQLTSTYQFCCANNDFASITGTFSFDPDTESIVGPWSFSTPVGTFSSAGGGSVSVLEDFVGPGLDTFLFSAPSPSNEFLELTISDPQDSGPLTTGFDSVFQQSGFGNWAAVSGTLSVQTTGVTPEPSSLLLLGTGLLGLGPLIRRRFAKS